MRVNIVGVVMGDGIRGPLTVLLGMVVPGRIASKQVEKASTRVGLLLDRTDISSHRHWHTSHAKRRGAHTRKDDAVDSDRDRRQIETYSGDKPKH